MTVDQSQPPLNLSACGSNAKQLACCSHSPSDLSHQVMWSSPVLSVDGLPPYSNRVSWNALSSCRVDWFNNKDNRDNRLPRPEKSTSHGLPTPVQGYNDTEACYEDPQLKCQSQEEDSQLHGNLSEKF